MGKHVQVPYKPVEQLAMDLCLAPNLISQMNIFSKMKRRFGKKTAQRAINSAVRTMKMVEPDFQLKVERKRGSDGTAVRLTGRPRPNSWPNIHSLSARTAIIDDLQ